MRRRAYLQWQVQSLLWLAAQSAWGTGALLHAAPPTPPDVVIVKGSPAAATRAAVDLLGGMGAFVKPGQRVVIKPNMSFAQTPDSATNTHPDVVKTLLILCKEAGATNVRVLDHSLQNPQLALAQSGILSACDSVASGICHHLMEERFYREANIPGAHVMKHNAFMRDVLEADVLIAAPVAKSHGGAGVSLSLKGQMGLLWDRHSMHSTYPLDAAIVDMNCLIKPHLAVIDATRVLTSGGPSGPGHVITPGEIIASADPVAADATAVAAYPWYGRTIQPRQVAHLRLAAERGLGRMDIERLNTQRITL